MIEDIDPDKTKFKKEVHIIGAGFSGLSAASFLQEKGYQVHVHEKKSDSGGMIVSHQTENGTYETAANGFMGDENTIQFFLKHNIPFKPASKISNKRFIYRNSKLHQWPLNFIETLHFIFKLIINFLLSKSFKNNLNQISVKDWAYKNLTQSSCDYLISPALQGIYAGDTNHLSAKLILSSLLHLNSKRKKPKKLYLLVSGLSGTQDILTHLKKSLESKGVLFHFNSNEATHLISLALKGETKVILATSFNEALKLVEGFDSIHKFAAFLSQIKSLPLINAAVFFKQPLAEKFRGFGILFPKLLTNKNQSPRAVVESQSPRAVVENQSPRALGVLMNSIIFDRKSGAHLENWIFGGAQDPDILNLSDQDIRNEIIRSRFLLFNISEPVLDIKVTRWPEALPYYNLELEQLLQDRPSHPFLFLHGNYLGSIGLSKILNLSKELVDHHF